MAKHPNAISEAIFFGPHRTTFNAPVLITLTYDENKVKKPENIKPYIFNEINRSYEPVPKVRDIFQMQIDEENKTLTFESQVLGQFVLAEG